MNKLVRGGNVPLTAENPLLKVVTVGLQLKCTNQELKSDFQFGAILCDSNGRAVSHDDMVFFNQVASTGNTVTMRDDDAQVDIELSKIPADIASIDLVVWSNSGRRTLKQLSSVMVHLTNRENGQSIIRTEDYQPALSDEKALCLVSVYKYRDQWKVRSKGEGWSAGLPAMTAAYGLS